jgi:hypothetical protein
VGKHQRTALNLVNQSKGKAKGTEARKEKGKGKE